MSARSLLRLRREFIRPEKLRFSSMRFQHPQINRKAGKECQERRCKEGGAHRDNPERCDKLNGNQADQHP